LRSGCQERRGNKHQLKFCRSNFNTTKQSYSTKSSPLLANALPESIKGMAAGFNDMEQHVEDTLGLGVEENGANPMVSEMEIIHTAKASILNTTMMNFQDH
jgi:hypothetical protein